MKYWKEIRNQRSVWLFAGGFVLLLGVMTGMLCTLGRRGIIPICGITAALLAMAISYTAELQEALDTAYVEATNRPAQ